MNIDINTVWNRIIEHQGEDFRQIRGQIFTYSIKGSVLKPSTTDRNIPKSEFVKALDHVPLKNTIPLQNLQAPSYLYAILMDCRICKGLW